MIIYGANSSLYSQLKHKKAMNLNNLFQRMKDQSDFDATLRVLCKQKVFSVPLWRISAAYRLRYMNWKIEGTLCLLAGCTIVPYALYQEHKKT